MPQIKLSNLFNLPFIRSYSSGNRKFIPLQKTHIFLGSGFYSRLNRIYLNLVQLIASKNYQELRPFLQENFAQKLFSEMRSVESNRFKLTIHQFKAKPKGSLNKKFFLFRIGENIWNNDVTKIGLQFKVFFGEKFNRKNPLKIEKDGRNQDEDDDDDQVNDDIKPSDNGHIYRIGQFRYLRWYRSLSFLDNIKNLYHQQTYELLIRYSSKIYIEIQHYDESEKNVYNKQNPEEILTQIVLRTGNKQFNWVVVDINNLRELWGRKTQESKL